MLNSEHELVEGIEACQYENNIQYYLYGEAHRYDLLSGLHFHTHPCKVRDLYQITIKNCKMTFLSKQFLQKVLNVKEIFLNNCGIKVVEAEKFADGSKLTKLSMA